MSTFVPTGRMKGARDKMKANVGEELLTRLDTQRAANSLGVSVITLAKAAGLKRRPPYQASTSAIRRLCHFGSPR